MLTTLVEYGEHLYKELKDFCENPIFYSSFLNSFSIIFLTNSSPKEYFCVNYVLVLARKTQ